MPGDIRVHVGGVGHQPERFAAPDVLGAPIPTFPAVGVAHLQRVAPQQLQEPHLTAVRSVNGLGLAVAIALCEDCMGSVAIDDPPKLRDHDIQSLVPRDAHVAALAAVLGVAPTWAGGSRRALRVPVHPLQRIRDAVRRVDALLVPQSHRADGRLQRRMEGLATGLDLPRLELLRTVLPVVGEGADTHDLAVFHVHSSHVRGAGESRLAGVLDEGLFCALAHLLLHLSDQASADASKRLPISPAASRNCTMYAATPSSVKRSTGTTRANAATTLPCQFTGTPTAHVPSRNSSRS